VATLLFSTFMSNTAAANLLLPIGVSFATTQGAAVLPVGISIALAASIAMALPVSTPPNAIAYASGEFNTRDIARAGSIVGVLATLLIIAFGEPIITFWLSR
jgi:sodium-dependent dicarboxylate transporter 2/3/5